MCDSGGLLSRELAGSLRGGCSGEGGGGEGVACRELSRLGFPGDIVFLTSHAKFDDLEIKNYYFKVLTK